MCRARLVVDLKNKRRVPLLNSSPSPKPVFPEEKRERTKNRKERKREKTEKSKRK